MDKWAADLLRSGEDILLQVCPGGMLKRGGEVKATIATVGDRALTVVVEQEIEVPFDDVRSVRRPPNQKVDIQLTPAETIVHDGLADIGESA